MSQKKRDAIRRKLLRLLDRKALEMLSGRDRPWHADRKTLEADVLAEWPHDGVEDAIERVVEGAR